MHEVQVELNEFKHGAFYIEDESGDRYASMTIRILEDDLIVYHTDVSEKMQGRGISKKLFEKMLDYARENKLKVIALCPFVYGQFSKDPDQYTEIWKKNIKAKTDNK